MTEQEVINSEVQMKLALQDAKFNQFMEEMRDFKQEMRERDNQRHAEISELRNSIKEIYTTTDAKIESINKSVASIQESGKNQTLVTLLGIAAMVIAVLLK